AEQEGQQTETEATGAPQKHHYTLNQQVGSITHVCLLRKGIPRKVYILRRNKQNSIIRGVSLENAKTNLDTKR
ncbi:hypothetical protein, partial [Klebsiella pneumoniae]|uniref:hypothetical protein n=1 Tax=Klebsiella pneumoniae TaxID=573 RepID=UPI0031F5BA8B